MPEADITASMEFGPLVPQKQNTFITRPGSEGVTATAVESKDEARMLASKKTLKVLVEDGSENSDAVKSSPSP
jgi:hypothetical protein